MLHFARWKIYLLATLAVFSAVLLSGAEFSRSMFTRVWRSHEGMPGNEVTGLAQDGNGYLWIAYLNGLATFDGVRFHSLPLPLPEERGFAIRELLRTSGDRFWLALDGGTVINLARGVTNVFTAADGLSQGRPLSLVEARDGAIWIGYSDSSACRILGKEVTRWTAREGLADHGNCRLAADVEGHVWFAHSGRVGIWRGERFETLLNLGADHVRVARAREGGVWICADSRVLRYGDGKPLVEYARIQFKPRTAVPDLLMEDRGGALWVGTIGGGLYRISGARAELVETSQRTIMSLFEDREGSLWVGTGGGGLNRVRPRILDARDVESGFPLETARSVCVDKEGALWVVGRNGALARRNKGIWRLCGETDGWPGHLATCVTADLDGGIWIGTYRDGALHHWKDGRFATIDRNHGLEGGTIRLLLQDSHGALWIGMAAPTSLQRLMNGKLQSFALPSGSLAVSDGVEDSTGTVWLGTADGLLLRVEGDRLADQTPQTPWQSGRAITSMAATPDGSLWIGFFGAGLGRLRDGKLEVIGSEQGLPKGRICSIVPDDRGAIWLSTDFGILRISQESLDAVAEGRASQVNAIYNGSDETLNLQGFSPYSPSATRTPDHEILFPLLTGLAVVHPDRVFADPKPPQVVLERAIANDQPIDLPENDGVMRLKPGLRKLEFEFTAPTFVAPANVRFRQRLEGLDNDWTEIGTQRKVTFTRLPPGNYTYRVTACNYAGVWNDVGTSISIQVLPFFWQTAAFEAGCVVLVLLGLVGIVRYVSTRRLRQEVLRAQQEAALGRERARIAKDIHDDLGASLTQISLLSELAMRHSGDSQPDGHVKKLADTARRAFASLDEIVWAVNPRNDTLANLLDYLAQYSLDFLSPTAIRCRLDFPTQPPACAISAEVRHTLFLVLKEALNNVVKHSEATEVRLRASMTDNILEISIHDDGVGLGDTPRGPGADGLWNMRQRVENAGGKFQIASDAKSGTIITVEMNLPLNGALKEASPKS